MMFLNKLASRNNSDAATEFELSKREYFRYDILKRKMCPIK